MMRSVCAVAAAAVVGICQGGVAYPEPEGGWTYLYEGNQATAGGSGTGYSSLDETWTHDNSFVDQWDGSVIGGTIASTNRPGGVMSVTEGEITWLRIQDTGNPFAHQYFDPGSNRKIFLGHNITARGGTNNLLDDGFTLTFRARIPTTGVLDPLYPDRSSVSAPEPQPYPAGGDGFLTSPGGLGNIVVHQETGGSIGFSLSVAADSFAPGQPAGGFAGLNMNEAVGPVIAEGVGFGSGAGENRLPFDPTEWHEFWIAIRKAPEGETSGTHEVLVFMDGSPVETRFPLTAGAFFTGDDPNFYGDNFQPISYLAIGVPTTPQSAALDIDFIGYKLGAVLPPAPPEPIGVPITSVRREGDLIVFFFEAEAGRIYQVQRKETLNDLNWQVHQTFPSGPDGEKRVEDSISQAQRFYRVMDVSAIVEP